jgi:hypothetical protein
MLIPMTDPEVWMGKDSTDDTQSLVAPGVRIPGSSRRHSGTIRVVVDDHWGWTAVDAVAVGR